MMEVRFWMISVWSISVHSFVDIRMGVCILVRLSLGVGWLLTFRLDRMRCASRYACFCRVCMCSVTWYCLIWCFWHVRLIKYVVLFVKFVFVFHCVWFALSFMTLELVLSPISWNMNVLALDNRDFLDTHSAVFSWLTAWTSPLRPVIWEGQLL